MPPPPRRPIPNLPAFCSDVPEHWPGGKLPKLRPRPMDPDVTPPVRPGEGYACPHEAALDRLTAEQAGRFLAERAARLGVDMREHVDELLDAAEHVGPVRCVRLASSAPSPRRRPRRRCSPRGTITT